MSHIYETVQRAPDALDYYGLLAGGAPEDEFAGEPRQISVHIYPGSTAEEIAAAQWPSLAQFVAEAIHEA